MNEEIIAQVIAQMRRLVPALKKVSDETLTAWVEMADMFVCRKTFKDNYVKALALYTLHLAFLDGALKGEEESLDSYSRRVASFALTGEFSQTFAEVTKNNTDNPLLSTPWGKMFDTLNRRKRGRFALMTGARGGCNGL